MIKRALKSIGATIYLLPFVIVLGLMLMVGSVVVFIISLIPNEEDEKRLQAQVRYLRSKDNVK